MQHSLIYWVLWTDWLFEKLFFPITLFIIQLYLCGPTSQPGEEVYSLQRQTHEPRLVIQGRKKENNKNQLCNANKLTMNIFLGDAVGPDERGKPPHVSFEYTLMNRKLQVITCQDYWVFVAVLHDDWCVSIDVVCVELLLQGWRFDRFMESPVGYKVIPRSVRDRPVGGLFVSVQYRLIFVCFFVILSRGSNLFTRHDDDDDEYSTWKN